MRKTITSMMIAIAFALLGAGSAVVAATTLIASSGHSLDQSYHASATGDSPNTYYHM